MARAARSWLLLALLGAFGCAPAPPSDPCRQVDASCMSRCMSCGLSEYGPCRAKCSQAPPAATPLALSATAPAPPATATASTSAGGSAAPRPSAAVPPPAAPVPRFAGATFPPADFDPPHKRSAKSGDGHWSALGDAGLDPAGGPPLIVHTTVHPHPISRFMTVHVVAIDLERTDVHFRPGRDDPGVEQLPGGGGLIPTEAHARLLAVFNGGFLPRHGKWGMMAEGQTLVPAREGGCTIALLPDGRVTLSRQMPVADAADAWRAYRQTPPCLLQDGQLDERLKADNERAWGGRDPNRKTRRRSALGIDRSGRRLLYALGVEVGPRYLAEGLAAAGAVAAAQLDINWSWTRFLLFGERKGQMQVTQTLVPKMTHMRTGYVKRKVQRDFFYVLRRPPAR